MRRTNATLGRDLLLLLTVVLAAGPVLAASPAPVSDPPPEASTRLAASTLGDLSSFRAIASDTLAIVGKGDIPAARARIKDLETAWDKAEANLKARDWATWTAIDGKIDEALTDLRLPNPKPAACEASLHSLIDEMDRASRA